MSAINDSEPRCLWFRDLNLNGEMRWFAACKSAQGISCYYKWRANFCPWCSKPVADRDSPKGNS